MNLTASHRQALALAKEARDTGLAPCRIEVKGVVIVLQRQTDDEPQEIDWTDNGRVPSEEDLASIRERKGGCYMYRYFDQSGTLLYVGISSDWRRRMDEHRVAVWFSDARSVDAVWFPYRRVAEMAEGKAIHEQDPLRHVSTGSKA